MITSIFDRSKPINFVILIGALVLCYIAANTVFVQEELTAWFIARKIIGALAVAFSVFVLDFVINKNALTENNNYAIFLYVMLLIFFPNVLLNDKLLIANLFVLFGFRRAVSLRTFKEEKKKIFDSTFWICVACLFYDWSLLFLAIVFIAILLYKLKDFKNMMIPIIPVFIVGMLYFTYTFVFSDLSLLEERFSFTVDFNINKYKETTFSIPAIFSTVMGVMALIGFFLKRASRVGQQQTIAYMVFYTLVVALAVVLLSEATQGAELIFLLFPLSILMTNYLQQLEKRWMKEAILYAFVAMAIVSLVLHLTTEGQVSGIA